jgi:hypothetical protein
MPWSHPARQVSRQIAKWRGALLACAIILALGGEFQGQARTPDLAPRYCLIQAADSYSFLEKINEVSGQGYRLIAVTQAAGQSLSAIMERIEDSFERYKYVSVPALNSKQRFATPRKVRADVTAQINDAAGKGYHLRVTFPSTRGVLPDVVLMESNSRSEQSYKYALISPDRLASHKNLELSGLSAAGFQWTTTTSMLYGGALLLFERAPDASVSTASLESQPVAALKRFYFPENDVIRSQLPERQLRKLAGEGTRLVDFFGSPMQWVLAMQDIRPPTPPYEYVVLTHKGAASPPLAQHARASKVDAADLTGLGQQGFRLLRLSPPAPPFVMEKAPGSVKRYEYQFVTSPRLPDLAKRLNSPALADFHIVKLESLTDGLMVILEKTEPAIP